MTSQSGDNKTFLNCPNCGGEDIAEAKVQICDSDDHDLVDFCMTCSCVVLDERDLIDSEDIEAVILLH